MYKKSFRIPSGRELPNRYLNEFGIVLICAFADLPLLMGIQVLIGEIYSCCLIMDNNFL